ncbi:MAG: hypothetical protein DRN99_01270 [Thermoproteota archaeon]|nr:MAG: hypothetical protein DRN99_01270 [Candidatus Korarchaeota archaeon]
MLSGQVTGGRFLGGSKSMSEALKHLKEVLVVLVEPEDPLNIGSVARVMKNLGYRRLVLVNPVSNWRKRAEVTARRAVDVLEKAMKYNSLAEAIEGSTLVIGTTAKSGGPRAVVRKVIDVDLFFSSFKWSPSGMAIVFGRESIGLKVEELAMCDVLVRVPTDMQYPTLNLAVAAAIILYELRRSLRHRTKLAKPPHPRLRKELIICIEKLAEAAGYPEFKKRSAALLLRRVLLRRAPHMLTHEECERIVGLLKRVTRRIGENHATQAREMRQTCKEAIYT